MPPKRIEMGMIVLIHYLYYTSNFDAKQILAAVKKNRRQTLDSGSSHNQRNYLSMPPSNRFC